MAVTYNAWMNPDYIYQDNGGSFSVNQAANSVFDYFPDDAAVDDSLYFGDATAFRNVQVYIGTAFAATSVTFVWEYWNGSIWTTLAVTDGTSDWTNLGEQTIDFAVPEAWRHKTVNGLNKKWVRCRVFAVNTTTEGGANSTQICQVGDDTIVVTGGTSGTPLNMTTVYDADVAGGWNVVTKDGSSFVIRAAITWGDGSTTTYFCSLSELIEFRMIKARLAKLDGSGVYVQFGQYGLSFGGYGFDGSVWLFKDLESGHMGGFRRASGSPTLKAYGSLIDNTNIGQYTFYQFAGAIVAVDSNIGAQCNPYGGDVDADHCTFNYLVINSNPTKLTNSRVYITMGFRGAATVEGIDAYKMFIWAPSWPTNIYLKNCSFTLLTMQMYGMAGRGATVYVQYKFDLKVQDSNGVGIQGATVNFSGTESVIGDETTDANGDITSQWITYRKRTKVTGGEDSDVYYANPMTVTITKTGYKTKTMTYTMDRRREEVERLESRREV